MVRATSTFDGSTTLGLFCAVVAAIFLYFERSPIKRTAYVGLSLFGCLLALTSAPLMAFVIVTSVYFYDHLLKKLVWRWTLLIVILVLFYVALSMVSDDPDTSVIGHLTFDPSNGWLRMNTWHHASINIDLSPWFGYGFNTYGNLEDYWDQASVDCVFLVIALRFGLPAVALLLAVNIFSFLQVGSTYKNRSADQQMGRAGTAYTLTLVVFICVGLTIHFWNAPWCLWGFLVGVRSSLKEYYASIPAKPHFSLPAKPHFAARSGSLTV